MTRQVISEDDRYVGERIREARVALNMSQTELAELLGISYQQVQKYEHGINRINGGRINLLVTALRRPLSFFFPNATDIRASDPAISQFISSKDGHWIATNWFQMSSPARNAVREVMTQLITNRS